MKIGTFLWAMEQLIAGKKVVRTLCQKELGCFDFFITIDPADSQLVTDEGFSAGLNDEDISATDWIIWTPPVNYIPGTFPWAWEQLKAGKKVKRKNSKFPIKLGDSETYYTCDMESQYKANLLEVKDINATDWELA